MKTLTTYCTLILCTSFIFLNFLTYGSSVFTVDAGTYNAICRGDTLQLNAVASGGTAPYTYQWFPKDSVINSNNDTSLIYPRQLGSYYNKYWVEAYDAVGDTTTDTVYIDVDIYSLNLMVTNISCGSSCDGAANISTICGTSPFTFVWSTGETTQTINGLCTGSYSISVTDFNGDILKQNFNIGTDDLSLNTTITKPTCTGICDGMIDLIILSGTSPFTFLWMSGDTTEDITGLCASSYYVTVTDNNGCGGSIWGDIYNTENMNITLSANEVSCEGDCGGEVDLVVSGGTSPYLYSWSNGEITKNISSICKGTYVVSVSDNKGCNVLESTTVNDTVNWVVYDSTFWTPPSGGFIDAIAVDLNDKIWITPSQNFLIEFDSTGYTSYSTSNSGLSSNSIHKILIDRYGNKWFSTNNGVSMYTGTIWTTYYSGYYVYGLAESKTGNIAVSVTGQTIKVFDGVNWSDIGGVTESGKLIYDNSGNLWGISNSGLRKYDGSSWVSFNTSNSNIPSDFPNSLAVDYSDNIWIGFGDTLAKFDGLTFTIYDASNSDIPSNSVYNILVDDADNIWMSPGGDIIRFDPAAGAVSIYDQNNSVLTGSYNYTMDKDRWGRIWIGQWGHIVMISPGCDRILDGVWPGDANSNGIANVWDLLSIGIAFNDTGSVRQNASEYWTAQLADDWVTVFSDSVNHKHADCNGDGIVNFLDINSILLNYGQTHSKTTSYAPKGSPEIFLSFLTDTFKTGDSVSADVVIGNDTNSVTDIYGLAFSINYDPASIDSSSIFFDFSNSFLGDFNDTTTITVQKINHTDGSLDVGIVRTDKTGISGFGTIGTLKFIISDSISGVGNSGITELNFTINNLSATTYDEQEIPITPINDTLIIEDITSIRNNFKANYETKIYPNPNSGMFTVEIDLKVKTDLLIQLINITGQIIYTESVNASSYKKDIDLSGYAKGVYALKVVSDGGMVCRKVVYR